MIDPAKKYQTRDGREVRIYAVDGSGDTPVHAAVKTEDGWCACSWRADGKVSPLYGMKSDLIEVKPRIKREVWVNVLHETYRIGMFWTKAAADECAKGRIACVKLVIDCAEGEGL